MSSIPASVTSSTKTFAAMETTAAGTSGKAAANRRAMVAPSLCPKRMGCEIPACRRISGSRCVAST